MNIFKLSLLSLLLSLLSLPVLANAQQTVENTVCNERSSLMWAMGTEDDLDMYRVYMSTSPITEKLTENIFHELKVADLDVVIDSEGNASVTESLPAMPHEGPSYFRLTAIDVSGNESDMSNEIGCTFDMIPNAPVIQLHLSK